MSLLSDVFILVLLKETRSLPNVPRAEKVRIVCALISFAPMPIACRRGNLIGLRLILPAENVSPSMQLSTGQRAFACIVLFFLLNFTSIFLSIFSLRTVPIFQIFTGVLLIERIVSPESNHSS